jgi:hypothetical protein
MASISIVDYIHDLKESGFTDQQSEVQARKLEQVIIEIKSELKQDIKQELHIDDLVNKKDLDLAIEKIRYETLKFTVWTGVGVVAAIAGMLAKGFHWF